jgi:predicted dehydrogenase
MNILVIGLGSMGKRRVRNLQALGYKNIAGLDIRNDRKEFASNKYKITTFDNFDIAVKEFQPEVFVISTPPDLHMKYAYYAFEKGIHCFIEGSVVDADKILALSIKSEVTDVVIVPSCTMRFYPGPIKIKELVRNGIIGKPLNFNYHTGQYLPDWHPWEKIDEFYVSNPETGGCREIVPFELTWLNDIFGDPKPLACVKRKLTNINAPIDDIYHCLLGYPGELIGNLTIEVVSRPKVTREFRLIGSKGEIVFSGDNNSVKYINTSMDDWHTFILEAGNIEKQYINPEEPYIMEMQQFTNAVISKDRSLYSNSLYEDYRVLQTLYECERLSEGSK